MNHEDTKHCAAIATRLIERLAALSQDIDRAAIFERAVDTTQLKGWVAAADRCTDAAQRLSEIIEDTIAAKSWEAAAAQEHA